MSPISALGRGHAVNGAMTCSAAHCATDSVGPQYLAIDALIARAHGEEVKELILPQRHRRRTDRRALHYGIVAGGRREGHAAGAWRAGRRRTRLSRRRRAVGGDRAADTVLGFLGSSRWRSLALAATAAAAKLAVRRACRSRKTVPSRCLAIRPGPNDK